MWSAEVLGIVANLAAERMAILIVTHEMGFIRDVRSKVYFLEGGIVHEEGRRSGSSKTQPVSAYGVN